MAMTQDPDKIGPGFDSLSTVGFILDRFPGLIPRFLKARRRQPVRHQAEDRHAGRDLRLQGAAAARCQRQALQSPLPDARKAIETLIQLYRDIRAGAARVRLSLCPASRRLCWRSTASRSALMVSIDGIDSSLSRAFFAAAAARIEAAGTCLHPALGQDQCLHARPRSAAYKANVQKWKDARRQVLRTIADRQMFNNDYIAQRGPGRLNRADGVDCLSAPAYGRAAGNKEFGAMTNPRTHACAR
jgi:hypothetical protein